ncbi:MAG TPA: hypothetical protein VNI84_01335, partial [Pyrinomonadaceae bacterium]|nr:hypothetical protein [Pyrinomonadaceae bacterium]
MKKIFAQILLLFSLVGATGALPAFAQLGQSGKNSPPYLGRRAANPNCRITGAQYYNTVSNEYRYCILTGAPGTWVSFGGSGAASPLLLEAATAGETPLIVKGAAGQTADLLNVRNSAGQTFFTIDSNGRVQLTNSESNGVFTGYAYVFQVNTAGGIVMTDGFGNTFFEYKQFKTRLIPRHFTASPASLAANQNDYAPGVNAGVLRLSSSLAVSITGFANAGANQEGDLKTMINV